MDGFPPIRQCYVTGHPTLIPIHEKFDGASAVIAAGSQRFVPQPDNKKSQEALVRGISWLATARLASWDRNVWVKISVF